MFPRQKLSNSDGSLDSFSQFPLATTVTSLSTAAVPARTKGTLVGIEHSIFAAAGALGPAVGAPLFQARGVGGLAAAGAAAYGLLLAFWRSAVLGVGVRSGEPLKTRSEAKEKGP